LEDKAEKTRLELIYIYQLLRNTGIGNVHEIRNGNELYHKGHQRTVGIIEQDK
jgi:hypothetical protein